MVQGVWREQTKGEAGQGPAVHRNGRVARSRVSAQLPAAGIVLTWTFGVCAWCQPTIFPQLPLGRRICEPDRPRAHLRFKRAELPVSPPLPPPRRPASRLTVIASQAPPALSGSRPRPHLWPWRLASQAASTLCVQRVRRSAAAAASACTGGGAPSGRRAAARRSAFADATVTSAGTAAARTSAFTANSATGDAASTAASPCSSGHDLRPEVPVQGWWVGRSTAVGAPKASLALGARPACATRRPQWGQSSRADSLCAPPVTWPYSRLLQLSLAQ